MPSIFTAVDPGQHLANEVLHEGVKSTPMLSALLTRSARAMSVDPAERMRQDLILEKIGAVPAGAVPPTLGQSVASRSLQVFAPPLLPGASPSLGEILLSEVQDERNESARNPGPGGDGGGDGASGDSGS
jgi:hypothetical protein